MVHRFVPLLAALAALGIAGCGSSSSSTESGSTQAQPLSKTEFIAQADALCTQSRKDQAALKQEGEKLSENIESKADVERLAELLKQSAARTSEELTQIRALEPPAADKTYVDAMLTTVESQQKLIGVYAKALEANKGKEAKVLAKIVSAAGDKGTKMAEEYGLKVCGQ